MLPGKKYTIEEVLSILARRKWLVVLPVAVTTMGGVFAYQQFPEEYRSETLIMVVPQRIPDSYVKSTVTATIEDRLASITDQIQSRSRLERIITDFDLYQDARANGGIMEDIVQRMRNDTKTTLIGKEAAFRISYVNKDPRLAQKVTERLASLYIEENLRDRANLAEGTNQFLESQLEDAKQRLVLHEKKLEEYRRLHAGQLPTQLQSNLQAIQNAQMQLQSVSESINRARERRLVLERQLGEAQVPTLPLVSNSGVAQGESTPSAGQQLELAQARLEVFRLRYTPDHPDVKSLQRTISELQAKVDEESRRTPDPTAGEKPVSPAELMRQKRIKDLQADIDVIDRQIVAAQAQEGQLKSRIQEYQSKVDVLPKRESELIELTRDYSTLQETYSSLLKKREDSKLAANLEQRQIGEQFKILDPASLPQRPYNQLQRVMILVGAMLGGLVFGIAGVVVFEVRDSSFKSEEDVLRVLTLPVLALVPVMQSTSDRTQQRRQRKRALAVAIAGMLLLITSAAAVVWRLQF